MPPAGKGKNNRWDEGRFEYDTAHDVRVRRGRRIDATAGGTTLVGAGRGSAVRKIIKPRGVRIDHAARHDNLSSAVTRDGKTKRLVRRRTRVFF